MLYYDSTFVPKLTAVVWIRCLTRCLARVCTTSNAFNMSEVRKTTAVNRNMRIESTYYVVISRWQNKAWTYYVQTYLKCLSFFYNFVVYYAEVNRWGVQFDMFETMLLMQQRFCVVVQVRRLVLAARHSTFLCFSFAIILSTSPIYSSLSHTKLSLSWHIRVKFV